MYLENIPPNCNARFIWRIASKFAKVLDVFVPKKLSKYGKRFPFIRVESLSIMFNLIKILNFLWIGFYKLRATKSHFPKFEA